MSNAASAAPDRARASDLNALGRFLKATELDTRMLGMVGALLIIWIGLHILSGGLFLTPRNLWNLSVQSSSIAIMATGMVLVIVTRNIDLSVGSILGFVGMIMGGDAGRIPAPCARYSARQPVDLDHRAGGGPSARPVDRRVPGLSDRLSEHSRLYRHAWRPAGLARRGVVGDQRPHRGADGRDLQADGRRRRRVRSARPGAGSSASSPARRSSSLLLQRPHRSASASNSRCVRSGPKCFSAPSPARVILGAVLVANSYPWPIDAS